MDILWLSSGLRLKGIAGKRLFYRRIGSLAA
jgi:hypothetical protein